MSETNLKTTKKDTEKSTGETTPLAIAYLLGVFAVIAFGATLPVTRIALVDFTPGFLTFGRAVFASTLAIVALFAFGRRFAHPNQIAIFISGVLLIHAFPGFMAIAMQTVPASHGGVILGFLPLATAIVARVIADEKPSPKFWILSILGLVIVVGYIIVQHDETGGKGISSGDLWLILAGLSASIGYVIFGKLSRSTSGWEIISRALLLNLPLTLLGFWWFYQPDAFAASTSSIAALLYLGAFSMFLAFCAWNAALAIGGISRMGQLQLFQTFVTIAVSALLLRETLDMLTITAACAITVIIAWSRKG